MIKKDASPEMECEKLRTIISLVSLSNTWKDTFEELFTLIREDLLFDNLVIYQTEFDTHSLEVLFAKSTGRGKSAEADASWGESIATRVIHEKQLVSEEPDSLNTSDRLASAYLLGVPITPVANLPGVLIFIRFGGPSFTSKDKQNAQWLADVVTTVVRRKLLDEIMIKMENIQSISKLQSDFISTISHELRSPLGFIKGYTTTLLRTDTNWDRETQMDFLEIIERETNNLTSLIDDLLDSSRLQSGQMKFDFHIVRLDSLIRDEVNRIHLTNPQQQVELDFEPDIPAIEGDSRKLAQVFDNLLSNANKYAPESKVQIKLRKFKDHLEIEFSDHGPGIPEMYLPRIFTRFFRVPEQSMKAHGSGLGLFICKQIIENHNGSINAESSNKGTIFTISLPFALSTSRVKTEVAA